MLSRNQITFFWFTQINVCNIYAYQTIMNPVIDNINEGFELSNIHDKGI